MVATENKKVRIKNEEQIRIKKRKRPDSAATLKKKAKLTELTEKQESVKKQGMKIVLMCAVDNFRLYIT